MMQGIIMWKGINISQTRQSVSLPLQMKLIGEVTWNNLVVQGQQAIKKCKLWSIHALSN